MQKEIQHDLMKISQQPKIIGIFGTSANPPTGVGGHYSLVAWAAHNPCLYDQDQKLMSLDEIWVLPVYKHINDKNSSLVSFTHRFHMAKLNFSDLPDVQVKTIEKDICSLQEGSKIGTIDTVQYLQEKYPCDRFVLLLGEDTYRGLHAGKWKRSKELLSLVDVVGIKRKPFEGDEGKDLFEVKETKNVSSTFVREDKHKEKENTKQFLRKEVHDYIKSHNLYQE